MCSDAPSSFFTHQHLVRILKLVVQFDGVSDCRALFVELGKRANAEVTDKVVVDTERGHQAITSGFTVHARLPPAMAKFGVSLNDDLAERIEQRRVSEDASGDTSVRSRSAVIAEYVELGVAAADIIAESDLDLPDERAKRMFMRQALLNELDREGLDRPDDW